MNWNKQMSYIESIRLSNFRNYETTALSNLDGGFIVLSGPNGAGKTNLLEAISYLSPGRGLRGAKPLDLQKADTQNPWAVATNLRTSFGDIKIGCGKNPENDRRITKIQGETIKNQTKLSEYLSCIWLTPQMDGLFRGGASERRRFIDRLLLTYDPSHAGRTTRYENALSQRAKILKDETRKPDPVWLKGLETQMAETGVAISAARLSFLERLQKACHKNKGNGFPVAQISFKGTIENNLETHPAVEVEDLFLKALEDSRHLDAVNGGASVGPHRTDLRVIYEEKKTDAYLCSTGEQKSLLIGLILAHARLLLADSGRPPILLLDEVAAHLDETRRGALYEILSDMGNQVWMTGTDLQAFNAISKTAQFFDVQNGQVI
ncbi:MAG: DNA replication/repair protein RecF [Bdellovibrionales bacterium]